MKAIPLSNCIIRSPGLIVMRPQTHFSPLKRAVSIPYHKRPNPILEGIPKKQKPLPGGVTKALL